MVQVSKLKLIFTWLSARNPIDQIESLNPSPWLHNGWGWHKAASLVIYCPLQDNKRMKPLEKKSYWLVVWVSPHDSISCLYHSYWSEKNNYKPVHMEIKECGVCNISERKLPSNCVCPHLPTSAANRAALLSLSEPGLTGSSDCSPAPSFTNRCPWDTLFHSSPSPAVCLPTHIRPWRQRTQQCPRNNAGRRSAGNDWVELPTHFILLPVLHSGYETQQSYKQTCKAAQRGSWRRGCWELEWIKTVRKWHSCCCHNMSEALNSVSCCTTHALVVRERKRT